MVLKDYSSTVAALKKQFTIKVICELQKVSLFPFAHSQVSLRIKVDPEPLIIDYSLSYAPLCKDCLTIELSPSLPFVELDTTASKIKIFSKDLSVADDYSIKLTATPKDKALSDFTKSRTLELKMVNLC